MAKSNYSEMKLGAPIPMVLLVVALIGLLLGVTLIQLQPLVATDSDVEMGNCPSVVTLALSPCFVPRSSYSRICCKQMRALHSIQIPGNRDETCHSCLLRNPAKFGFDQEKIASLIGMCHLKRKMTTSLLKGHGGTNKSKTAKPSRNSTSAKSSIPSLNGSGTPTDLNHEKVALAPTGGTDLRFMLFWALAALVISSCIPIYDLFHDKNPCEIPTTNIDSMISFVLVMWYGFNTGNDFSTKISFMNGAQAFLELIQIIACLYRNRSLWKASRNRLGKFATPCFLFFAFIQWFAEPKPRKHIFAVFSTVVSVITSIYPLFTLSKERRDSSKKENAFIIRRVIHFVGNLMWFAQGLAMGDTTTQITSFTAIVVGLASLSMQAEYPMTEEGDKKVKKEGKRVRVKKERVTFLTRFIALKWLHKIRGKETGTSASIQSKKAGTSAPSEGVKKERITFVTRLVAVKWLQKLRSKKETVPASSDSR